MQTSLYIIIRTIYNIYIFLDLINIYIICNHVCQIEISQ